MRFRKRYKPITLLRGCKNYSGDLRNTIARLRMNTRKSTMRIISKNVLINFEPGKTVLSSYKNFRSSLKHFFLIVKSMLTMRSPTGIVAVL